MGLQYTKKMDNLAFTEIKLSRRENVRIMNFLNEQNAKGKQKDTQENNSLFHRLLILAERSQAAASYFSYELTTVSIALFKEFNAKT